MEVNGHEVMGKVISGKSGDFKRPRFIVEFPTTKGPHQKEFGFSREEGVHIRGGTDETIANPDVLIRYNEDYPDAARLAANTPLPWWGGLIGMSVVISALWFTMWLPGKAKR